MKRERQYLEVNPGPQGPKQRTMLPGVTSQFQSREASLKGRGGERGRIEWKSKKMSAGWVVNGRGAHRHPEPTLRLYLHHPVPPALPPPSLTPTPLPAPEHLPAHGPGVPHHSGRLPVVWFLADAGGAHENQVLHPLGVLQRVAGCGSRVWWGACRLRSRAPTLAATDLNEKMSESLSPPDSSAGLGSSGMQSRKGMPRWLPTSAQVPAGHATARPSQPLWYRPDK